jgi:hypothetical protein
MPQFRILDSLREIYNRLGMDEKVSELSATISTLVDATEADTLAGADLDAISKFMQTRGNQLAQSLISQADVELLAIARALGSIEPQDFADEAPESEVKLSCSSQASPRA